MANEDKALSRRRFLTSIFQAGKSIPELWAKEKVGAVAGVPQEARRKTAVSPPGSQSHKHLNQICDGCQECISKCPTKVLRPCTSEYDMAAVLQPVMDFTKGYCDLDCTKCSEVCHNGAISRIDYDDKLNIRIGHAVLVRELCINNSSDGRVCSRCADECPFTAIKMKEDYNMLMVGAEDNRHYPKFPVIEDILCIGCGKCEFVCSSSYAKAIHVEGFEEHQIDEI